MLSTTFSIIQSNSMIAVDRQCRVGKRVEWIDKTILSITKEFLVGTRRYSIEDPDEILSTTNKSLPFENEESI